MSISVGDLIRNLERHDRDAEVYFGGLVFFRLKQRGKKLVQLEFNQQVYVQDGREVVIENLGIEPHNP